MQPLAAPDPVGLAAAPNLLGQPNIFRDMSGTKEVQQLLSGLASGAVDLAKAQQKPEERYDNLQVIENAREKGQVTDSQANEAAARQLGVPAKTPQPSPTSQKTQQVEIRLRGFVPSEIWEPAPSLIRPIFTVVLRYALQLICLTVNNRDFFSKDKGTSSRIELPIEFTINPSNMTVVEGSLVNRGLLW